MAECRRGDRRLPPAAGQHQALHARRSAGPTFAEQEAYLTLTAFAAGLEAAGRNATRQSFMAAMSKMSSYDGGGLLSPLKLSFRDYTPANGCLWVATLKGQKFFVAPGTPICSSEVKFNG